MENCTFGEHPAVLVKLKLLANIAIYWPIPNLANKSEQIKGRDRPVSFKPTLT
jgi:hypothetical protein